MVITWTVTAIIFGALATIGAAADRFLLHRHKTSLHLKLIKWWCQLDEIELPHIPRKTVAWTLGVLERWPLLSWRFLAASLIVSFLLTSVASGIGLAVDPWQEVWSPSPFPSAALYASNYVCDIVTFLVTLMILRLLAKCGALKSLLAVLADSAFAVLIAMAALPLNTWAADYAHNHRWPGTSFAARQLADELRPVLLNRLVEDGIGSDAALLVLSRRGIVDLVQESPTDFWNVLVSGLNDEPGQVEVVASGNGISRSYLLATTERCGWYEVLPASTTLLPTALYMSVFAVLLLGWSVLRAAHQVAKLILERATEDDPRASPEKFIPFTLLGLLLGSIAAIAKMCVAVASTVISASGP